MTRALQVNRKLQRNRNFKYVLLRWKEHVRQDWVVQAEETEDNRNAIFRILS
jgi:hypothetical protein